MYWWNILLTVVVTLKFRHFNRKILVWTSLSPEKCVKDQSRGSYYQGEFTKGCHLSINLITSLI